MVGSLNIATLLTLIIAVSFRPIFVRQLTVTGYHLLHAVITVESAYNAHAVSRAGAQGLMQLMPATAERFGVKDPFNPKQNINGGSRYLSYLMELFNGDFRLALAAYNAGENAVKRHGNRIPPYKETQNYVRKVMKYYKKYRLQKTRS